VGTDRDSWKTKPTDRFVLKWIKCHLSAPITPRLITIIWLKPWMITVCSSCVGVTAGVFFGLGWGWLAGLLGICSQILDGVDGQLARLTGSQSPQGAYLDSVVDRYADGAMMIGLFLYLLQLPLLIPLWQMLILGSLAFIGSNLVSYSSAKAESLQIVYGKATLASKGTRMTVMILSGLGSFFWAPLPIVALGYLAIHPNLAVMNRILHSFRSNL
jgi:phosphatidylglycerophosphate synthase